MKKESIPFSGAMGMKVAFCNAMAIDISKAKKMIWVTGQVALDEGGHLIGKGDMGAQTEQCVKNIESALEKLGGHWMMWLR